MVLHAYSGSSMSLLVPSIRMQPDCAGKASLPPACLLSFLTTAESSLYHFTLFLRPELFIRREVRPTSPQPIHHGVLQAVKDDKAAFSAVQAAEIRLET